MEKLDNALICDLVKRLDEAVPRDGAAVIHGLDEMFEAGIEEVFGVDDRPISFIPGLANRKGLLRFGIEHLKLGIAEQGKPDESEVAEAETAYLSGSCFSFGYVRQEEFDYAGFKKIQVSDFGWLGNALMVIVGILLLVAAIVGIVTIVGWVGNKFF